MTTQREPKTLTLSTKVVPRDRIVIDEAEYEIKNPEEFTLADIEEASRIAFAWEQWDATEAEADEDKKVAMVRIIRRWLRLTFVDSVDETVIDKLQMNHLYEIGDFLAERWPEDRMRQVGNQAGVQAARRSLPTR